MAKKIQSKITKQEEITVELTEDQRRCIDMICRKKSSISYTMTRQCWLEDAMKEKLEKELS